MNLDRMNRLENETVARQIESGVNVEEKPFSIEEPYNPATDDKRKAEFKETEDIKTKVILDADKFFGKKSSNEIDEAFSKLFPKLSAKEEAKEMLSSKSNTQERSAQGQEITSKIVSDRNVNEGEVKETKPTKPKKAKKVQVPQPNEEEEQPVSLFKQRMLEKKRNG